MPFIRISYRQQAYTNEQLTEISHELMHALQQHFQVPDHDFFQVFHAHEQGQFMYDETYLDVQRSDRLLYIQITLGSGRSVAQKQAFYVCAAERLQQQAGVRKQDVFIVLVETGLDNWSFGNGQAQMIQREHGDWDVASDHMANAHDHYDQTAKPLQTNDVHSHTNQVQTAILQTDHEHTSAAQLHSQPTMPPTSNVQHVYGELAPDFARYSETVLFGDLWCSPELSPRERSLLTIAALVAGRHTGQLPYHIDLAQQNGITITELAAVMTHLAFYAGWPAAAASLLVLQEQTQSNL
ncbi:tautomerase family protein [Paenibacillus campi]|uniref:tautomerase family protein n=1 Tax=Paenibacillus campi TaxID=3106031 RepID=UPI002AFF6CE2|nr:MULTISPECIES: tautomerase family protein [unclassified Paenibacillus]